MPSKPDVIPQEKATKQETTKNDGWLAKRRILKPKQSDWELKQAVEKYRRNRDLGLK